MFRQFIATVTLIAFTTVMCVMPTSAHADEPEVTEADPPAQVTTLRLGDPAPFDGTLFSVTAAARILTDLEFSQEQCDLQINQRLALRQSEFQLQLDTQLARYTALEYRHNELMLLRTQQVDFLTQNYEPQKWYQSGEFWFAMGVIGGVLITVGAGYAIGQAN